MVSAFLLVVTAVALGAGHGAAFDPNPLQDFCVADTTSKVRVNGVPCKDPATVVANDFFFPGVDRPGGTDSRRYGFSALSVQIPGLNTLGASHARIDVAPGGVFPLHYHPRASETAVVLEGAVYFGFVTSYPENKLFAKVLRKGDVFAVPQGLVHFLYNNGTAPAALYATLSSQNPGLVLLGDVLFGAGLADDLLAKTFLTDRETVHKIGAKWIRS
uniref:Germin-like protein n=1 Tax=Arundo donax TaxID=35708 RepID=A0A0A8ZS07_ARUDO